MAINARMMSLEQDDEMTEELRSWSDLPMDILQLIASRLPTSAHPYFASVCSSWWLSSSFVYPVDICPLLMHYKKSRNGLCHYYSPFLNKTFTVGCPHDLSGTKFHFAKEGWLLLSRGTYEIILVNPFCVSSYEVVNLEDPYNFNGVAFSHPPTSPDFMIFGIESVYEETVEIGFYRGGEWSYGTVYENNMPFILSFSNPVFYHGLFYCLGARGNLGVFDPNEETWTTLSKPCQLDTGKEKCFLVESGGELLSVFIGKPIRVLRLNQADMVWETVTRLEDRMLFAGWPMALSATAPVRRMGNKVYSERFRGEPQIIKVEVKCCGGRIYFVWKRSLASKPDDGKKETNKDEVCYYSLECGENPEDEVDKFYRYVDSIWFEPRIAEGTTSSLSSLL